ENAVHLLADMIALDRSDETEITDVDAEDGNARALEPVRGLEQGAVTTAGHDEVGFDGRRLLLRGVGSLAAREGIKPFLADLGAVEDFLERARGFLGVGFAAVDKDDDFADFHDATLEMEYTWIAKLFK